MDFYRLMLYIVLLHSFKSTSGYSVLALVTDFFLSSYEKLRCPLGDCCNNHWIPNNTTSKELYITARIFFWHCFLYTIELQELLKQDVFGQHIATEVVSRQIEAHLSNPSPSKPLVLSFHGWTGNGKNHVAYLIAKSLFMKETDSQFYHHFISTVHFPHQVIIKVTYRIIYHPYCHLLIHYSTIHNYIKIKLDPGWVVMSVDAPNRFLFLMK